MESGDKVILWTRDLLNDAIKGLEKQTVESVDENVVKLDNGFVCDITTVLTVDEACEMLQDALDELRVLDEHGAKDFIDGITNDIRFIDVTTIERLVELEKILPEDTEIDLPCDIEVCPYPEEGLTKNDLKRVAKLGFGVKDGYIHTIY